jgi:hypothetical protein
MLEEEVIKNLIGFCDTMSNIGFAMKALHIRIKSRINSRGLQMQGFKKQHRSAVCSVWEYTVM